MADPPNSIRRGGKLASNMLYHAYTMIHTHTYIDTGILHLQKKKEKKSMPLDNL